MQVSHPFFGSLEPQLFTSACYPDPGPSPCYGGENLNSCSGESRSQYLISRALVTSSGSAEAGQTSWVRHLLPARASRSRKGGGGHKSKCPAPLVVSTYPEGLWAWDWLCVFLRQKLGKSFQSSNTFLSGLCLNPHWFLITKSQSLCKLNPSLQPHLLPSLHLTVPRQLQLQ